MVDELFEEDDDEGIEEAVVQPQEPVVATVQTGLPGMGRGAHLLRPSWMT